MQSLGLYFSIHPPATLQLMESPPGLGPMMISLVSNSSASLCVFLGMCMVFWWTVGEGLSDTLNQLEQKPNLLLKVFLLHV